ncbi:MAG: hypothetical protein QGG36_14150 [Pirellulaceae bacterium]|nr:hypothetical protein [Pirellulaceae bacterium]
MNARTSIGLCIAIAVSCLLVGPELMGQPPAKKEPPSKRDDSATKKKTAVRTPSVAEARARAKLLHTTYESTLIAVHRAYFEEGKRQTIPARVLEGVFFWVDQDHKSKTRWISVNTDAMNVDHEPKSDIEKKAAKALAAGADQFELVEDGVYHRAGAITLVAGCLRCHESSLSQNRKRRRVAGLVISMPVKQD